MDTNIAGAGGSGTRRLRAVLVRNSAGAGGFKKTVPRRALVLSIVDWMNAGVKEFAVNCKKGSWFKHTKRFERSLS